MKNVGIAKDAEIIDLGERIQLGHDFLKGANNKKRISKLNESTEKKFYEKRVKTDNSNSYATEKILKTNFVKDRAKQAKSHPGFTDGKVHSFSGGSCWDENGRLKTKGA